MNKYFYPIFKLPTFYERDYVKEELPLWIKWWLLGKAGRELSEILTGSEFTLLHTLNKKFKIFKLKGQTSQTQLNGSNQFNAFAINNSNIQVLNNGKTIKLPVVETGNGYTSTSTRLYDLCPNVTIGDTVYLYFTRSQELQSSNLVYFEQAEVSWLNGTSIQITETILNSLMIMYGNRASSGETEQITLTDFRIVKTQNEPFEIFCGRNT